MKMKRKLNVLFLCTGNSCRSQMAEGWARHFHSDQIVAYSAGTSPQVLNPNAVSVMQEVGVDIGSHAAQHLDEVSGVGLDLVVTVCKNAHENCPVFPQSTKVLHFGFDDPPALAEKESQQDAKLGHYRRVRDEIRDFISSDLTQHIAS